MRLFLGVLLMMVLVAVVSWVVTKHRAARRRLTGYCPATRPIWRKIGRTRYVGPRSTGERRGSVAGQAHLDRMTRALGSRDKRVARRDAHTCMEGSAGIDPSIPAWTTGMSGLGWRDK